VVSGIEELESLGSLKAWGLYILRQVEYHVLRVPLQDVASVTFPSPGFYKLGGSVPAPQLQCSFLGAGSMTQTPTALQGAVVQTDMSLRDEVLLPPSCVGFPSPACNDNWNVISGSAKEYYVADVHLFMVTLEHVSQ
jgi:hypothetical protein